MSKSRSVSLIDPEKTTVILKRLNYSRVAELLKSHPPGVFMEAMDRRSVPWVKKRLQALTGKKVHAEPVFTETNGQRREGYSFKLED